MNEEENLLFSENYLQLVCFKFADEEYAVDITYVREVVRVQNITPIPQMPDFSLGVINIRGHIIPVFDFRRKFRLQEKEADEKTKLLIAEIEGEEIAFIVDEILDNIKISQKYIDPSPEVQMKIKRESIKGIGQLENRMIIILDLENLHEDIMASITAFSEK